MTAVVSRERAKATCLTGAAGVLMLAIAFVMMVVAAPGHLQVRPNGAAKSSTAQLTTDVCHQLTSRSDSATVRACRAGPSAEIARADAYVPAMISESWSASSSGRTARPPLAASEMS
jgi:hypothetical protein